MMLLMGCEGSASPAPGARDRASGSQTPSSNAAAEYRRIHTALPKNFMGPLAGIDPKKAPNETQAQYLESKQSVVSDIIATSKIEHCDFGTEYGKGFGTVMPHLTWLQDFAKLLQYDAHRLIVKPDGQRGAAERLAACIRVSQHAASEPALIAKLVAMTCLSLANEATVEWKERWTDPDAKSELRKQFEAVRESAVYDLSGVLRTEFAAMKKEVENAKGALTLSTGNNVSIDEADKAGIIAELDRVEKEMQKVWHLPDADEQFKTIIVSMTYAHMRQLCAALPSMVRQIRLSRSRVEAAMEALQASPTK